MKYGGWRPDHNPGIEANEFRNDAGHLIKPDPEMHLDLQKIFKLYLSSSAPFEVNLNSGLLKSMRKCFHPDGSLIENSTNNIFQLLCQAQNEIFKLMHTDS